VKHKVTAIVTGVLVPLVLAAGLLTSAIRGGPGISLGQSVFEIHKVEEAHFPPPPDKPFFVLVMGNDARGGEGGTRGDALHLIGVNPAAGQATILNIPRDTWAAIPGRGTDKINSAHVVGGPQLQARAVAQLVGVEISFVISTGFVGFVGMVDELGGFDINVPVSMADANSGAYFSAGPTHMDGHEALAFSRNRNLSGGDFRRTEHQGLIILAALAQLRAAEPTPPKIFHWLTVLYRHARVDGVSLPDLYHLGRFALTIDPANVRAVTMPGSAGQAGSQSVVYMGAAAPGLFADMRDDAILQSH
jgi:LCP family protein required for cell wall assembly